MCGALSLILLVAEFVLHLFRERGKAEFGLYGKELEARLKQNADFKLALKEWNCMAKHDKARQQYNKKFIKLNATHVMRHAKAKALHMSAGFEIDQKVDNDGLAKMVALITDNLNLECGLCVFREDKTLEYATHQGEEHRVRRWFNILHTNTRHYQAIDGTTLMAFQQSKIPWCYTCQASRGDKHMCERSCRRCKFKQNCDQKVIDMKLANADYVHQYKHCHKCNEDFVDDECYERHFKTMKCGAYWTCTKCNLTYDSWKRKLEDHECDEIWCENCKKYDLPWPDHACFIKRKNPKPALGKVYYADIEVTQDTSSKNKAGKDKKDHVPNMICTQDSEGNEWPSFKTMEDWITEATKPQYRGATFLFHNAAGYDSHLVAERIAKDRKMHFTAQFAGGTKIREMVIYPTKSRSASDSIRIIDSMMFLNMSLRSFTDTFNLQKDGVDIKKGDYCHFLNKSVDNDWCCYLKEIPMKKFGYKSMTLDKQKEFKKWYDENLEYWWDNEKELELYCKADVTLLREGCEEFRRIVMEITEDKTPSMTETEYMNHFKLIPETYEQTKYDKYLAQDTKRKAAVDPFAYCTIAACAKAIFLARHLPEDKVAALPAKIDRMLRPAARGGRVDLHYMYWKAKEGQRGFYVDFTSLYPWVNRYGRYPVGHPEHLIAAESDLDTIAKCHTFIEEAGGLGVCWVDVECPQELRHPVLHYLRDDKLMFDLFDRKHVPGCYDGAAPYTNLELQEAILQGYKITKIHEALWWDEEIEGIFGEYVNSFFKLKTEADGRGTMTPEEVDVFADKFYKDMGIHINLDNFKPKKNNGLRNVAKMFLNSLWGKMGERLQYGKAEILYDDDESIRKDLMLEKKHQLDPWYVINEDCTLARIKPKPPTDDTVIVDKNIALAIFTTSQARLKLYRKFLAKLQHRVLYYDTDSCIFFCDAGEEPTTFIPKLGQQLGVPTNELDPKVGGCKDRFDAVKVQEADGSVSIKPYHIVEFFSGGPKNYGYLLNTGLGHITQCESYAPDSEEYKLARTKSLEETSFKCKGQNTKRADVAEYMNYFTARDAVLEGTEIMVNMKSCIRRPQPFQIASLDMKKVYRESWTKGNIKDRLFMEDGKTLHAITTEPWNNATRPQYEFLMDWLDQKPVGDKTKNTRPKDLKRKTQDSLDAKAVEASYVKPKRTKRSIERRRHEALQKQATLKDLRKNPEHSALFLDKKRKG
jgi:hypothetical protein